MSDLIPDSWRQDEGESQCCSQPRRSNRKGPVTDILLWLECYSSLVAVLASRYPSKVGHFMAYQKTIIKAQRSFIGEGWVIYDTCFRRKAANVKSLDWGEVDLTLYNETFVGRAKIVSRCNHCLSELHPSSECLYAPADPTQEGASWSSRALTKPSRQAGRPVPICLLYNDRRGDVCTFAPDCKYVHACCICQGRHPKSKCPRKSDHHQKGYRPRSPNRPMRK